MDELGPLTETRIIRLLHAIKAQQVDIQLIYASLNAFQKTIREVNPAVEQIYQRHMKAALDDDMPPAARNVIDAIDGLLAKLHGEGWPLN